MKTIIQLTTDRTKAHWKFQWDEKHPLCDMFSSNICCLMVDVTGIVPEPQEGWLYAGNAFLPPVPVMQAPVRTKDELMAELKQGLLDKQALVALSQDTKTVDTTIADLVSQIKAMD